MTEYWTDPEECAPCHECKGTGREDTDRGTWMLCHQCGGSGSKTMRVEAGQGESYWDAFWRTNTHPDREIIGRIK